MLIPVLAQILLTVVGQMLWKKGFDQSSGFLMPGQSTVMSVLGVCSTRCSYWARVFLGEQISLQRWIAVTLIAFSVFLMTRT
jgi:drug/metabolite transporter (DMT)-like permease